ncbi:MAG: hypothetical protein HXY50_12070 [Ignavibacteriaceae bacterium]|nr:hypothetical protein [Ignavibacteriaceae bacterium]
MENLKQKSIDEFNAMLNMHVEMYKMNHPRISMENCRNAKSIFDIQHEKSIRESFCLDFGLIKSRLQIEMAVPSV